MPWIDGEKCIGCGICIDECPVDTIVLEDEKAEILMDGCIRCGRCHDICPQDAVRHDSELVPMEIEANVERVKRALSRFDDEKERQESLVRFIKTFKRQIKVAEKTIEELEKLKTD